VGPTVTELTVLWKDPF